MGREWCRSRSLGKAKERRAVEKPPGCMKGILHLLHFRRSLLFSSLNLHHLDDRRTGGIERHSSPNGIRGVHGIYQSFASLLSESRDDNPTHSGKGSKSHLSQEKNDESQKEKVISSDDSTDQQAETPRTSNVLACLMGLEALPLTSPVPVPSLRPSSLHNQKENDGEDRRRRGKVTNPAPPQTRRKPLTVRSTNIPDLKSSKSLPETPRISTSGRRRSCDGETPRFSLQLHRVAMEEFDCLCEVVHERSLISVPRTRSSSSSSQGKRAPRPRLHGENKSVEKGPPATQAVAKRATVRRSDGNAENISSRRRPMNEKKRRSTATELPGERLPEMNQATSHKVDEIDGGDLNRFSSSSSRFQLDGASERKTSKTSKLAQTSLARLTEKPKNPPAAKTAVLGGASRAASGEHPPFNRPTWRRTSSSSVNQSDQRESKLPSRPSSPSPPQKTLESAPRSRQSREPVSCRSGNEPSPPRSNGESRSTPRDGEDSPEFRYLRMILEGVGLLGKIRSGLPATLARWHLPSHPLDPAGFHRLELSLLEEEDELRSLGHLSRRCNRKLLYDLVDEAVERLLRPCLGIKPWEHYRAGNSRAVVTIMRKKDGGEALLWHLWSRLRGFQQEGKGMTQLETLHLVEDFEDWNGVRCFASHPPVRKEMEAVVAFLEGAIVDSLMEEECHGLDLNLNNMLYNEWDL